MRLTLQRRCPLADGDLPEQRGHCWHCATCDEKVYDLSAMGAERAAALLRERAHGARICAEWRQDALGRVVFDVARTAAAAAALALASPALADGGDLPIDAIELIKAQNALRDQAVAVEDSEVPCDSCTVREPPAEVPPPMLRGRIRMPLPPPPAKP